MTKGSSSSYSNGSTRMNTHSQELKANTHNSQCYSVFKCSHPGCRKEFRSYSILTRHVRVHTGEKPYSCSMCGKGFSQIGNMTKHEKSHENSHLRWNRHTALKPFPCCFVNCMKSFTAKSSLRHHLVHTHRAEGHILESASSSSSSSSCSSSSPTVLDESETKSESSSPHITFSNTMNELCFFLPEYDEHSLIPGFEEEQEQQGHYEWAAYSNDTAINAAVNPSITRMTASADIPFESFDEFDEMMGLISDQL